jgi:hypothetical protein
LSRRALLALLAGATLPLLPGCQSAGDALELGALESLRIEGYSPEAIAAAVRRTFEAAGFQPQAAREGGREQNFDRPGSRADNARYGGWFSEETYVRIRVRLREIGGNVVEVRSDPFLVRGRGSMTVDEQPLNRRRVQEHGGLLAKARQALEAGDI